MLDTQGMAFRGETDRFWCAVGLVLAVVAGLGPMIYDAAHHRDRTGVAGYNFAITEPLSGRGDPRLVRQPGESTLSYVRRATRGAYQAVYHCDPTETQTWATSTLAFVSGGAFPGREGVLTPDALRCGFCSQVSAVLAQALRANGVPSARMRGLDGHVVVTFRERGGEYVADADYGVGPWAVDWTDPAATAITVRALYAGHGMPAGEATPFGLRELVALTAEASTDGTYDVARIERVVAAQETSLAAVNTLRWILVVCGLVLLTLVRPGTPRTGHSHRSLALRRRKPIRRHLRMWTVRVRGIPGRPIGVISDPMQPPHSSEPDMEGPPTASDRASILDATTATR